MASAVIELFDHPAPHDLLPPHWHGILVGHTDGRAATDYRAVTIYGMGIRKHSFDEPGKHLSAGCGALPDGRGANVRGQSPTLPTTTCAPPEIAFPSSGRTSLVQSSIVNPPAAGQRTAFAAGPGKSLPATSPMLLTPLAIALTALRARGRLVSAHAPFRSVHFTACQTSRRSQLEPTMIVPASLTARGSVGPPIPGRVLNVACASRSDGRGACHERRL